MMRNILLSSILILVLTLSVNAFAQNKKKCTQKKTEQTKVNGDKQVRKKRKPVQAEFEHANIDRKAKTTKKSALNTKLRIKASKNKKGKLRTYRSGNKI